MYVVQVKPQSELKTQNYLFRKGIPTLVPMSTTLERRRGKNQAYWIEVDRIVFNGYVFIDLPEISDAKYYKILNCDWVLRFLGEKGKPSKLYKEEIEFIKIRDAWDLIKDLPKERLRKGSQWSRKGVPFEIVAVDRRQRKIQIAVEIGDVQHRISLPYNVETNESENDALSNPQEDGFLT